MERDVCVQALGQYHFFLISETQGTLAEKRDGLSGLSGRTGIKLPQRLEIFIQNALPEDEEG
jgi:hypothetical protein